MRCEQAKKLIQEITENVWVETGMVACNLGLIETEEGLVMVDSPMNPTDVLKWREEVNKRGNLRYIINTEGHIDHATGVYFFGGTYISHRLTRERLAGTPVSAILQHIARNDPAGLALADGYRARLPDIAFTGSLEVHFGGLKLELFELPGHIPGGVGVYLPEKRVVFTGDVIFHRVKTWLWEGDPEKWVESLNKIRSLDVDFIVPGHGALCTKDYLDEQAAIVRSWADAVGSAFQRGLTEEEAQLNVTCPDPYEMQPGIKISPSDLDRGIVKKLYSLAAAKMPKKPGQMT